jgi:hypothetical protein
MSAAHAMTATASPISDSRYDSSVERFGVLRHPQAEFTYYIFALFTGDILGATQISNFQKLKNRIGSKC